MDNTNTVCGTTLSERISAKLPVIVTVLTVIQPLLDVISYFVVKLGFGNSLTLALRLFLLVVIFTLGYITANSKVPYYVLSAILLCLTVCHCAVCFVYGYVSPMSDIANLVRIYSLPIVTLSFISFFLRDRAALRAFKKAVMMCLFIIAAVEAASVVTGTNPFTYANKSIGIIGWFSNTNSQSAILSMTVPVAVAYTLERLLQKRTAVRAVTLIGVTLLGGTMLYLFATRLAYASLLGTVAVFTAACLIIGRKHKINMTKTAAFFALCAVLTLCLFGVSPMVKNQTLVAENAEKKQLHIDSLVADSNGEGVEALREAYEYYLPGLTHRFGLERTAELYDCSTDVYDIADVRRMKISYCELLVEDRPLSRIFGLSLSDLYYNGTAHDVENDFHGIYYLTGIVGLLLMLSFFAVFIVRAVRVLSADFRHHFTAEAVGFYCALICGTVHAYFTASVLRRPSASFYLAVILAAIYVISSKSGGKEKSK